MNERCPDWNELRECAALPPADPRRVHVEGCARCSARLATLGAFLLPPDVPAGARPEEARARLGGFLEKEVGTPGAAAHDGGAGAGWRRRLAALSSRRFQPALAFAALLVVATLAWGTWRARVQPFEAPLLRGSEADSASVPLALLPVQSSGDSLVLAWSAVPMADRYQVALATLDLVEIARFDTGPRAGLAIARADLPAAARREAALLWQVSALRGGDVLATSSPGRLPLR